MSVIHALNKLYLVAYRFMCLSFIIIIIFYLLINENLLIVYFVLYYRYVDLV